jgi:hypothetical protein
VTVTSSAATDGTRVWHIGGKIAEEGVSRDAAAQRAHAVAELRAVLPAVDFGACQWSTYMVDRAERAQPKGSRPEDACVEQEQASGTTVLTIWPTKMALAPVAADMVRDCAGPAAHASARPALAAALEGWDRPDVAPAPWSAHQDWVPTPEVRS